MSSALIVPVASQKEVKDEGHNESSTTEAGPSASSSGCEPQRLSLKDDEASAASTEQWHHADSVFGNDFRVAIGLLLNIDFNDWGREGNVGTAGAGGFAAFADPKHGLSYGYTPNRFNSGEGMGDQHGKLVAALYDCL